MQARNVISIVRKSDPATKKDKVLQWKTLGVRVLQRKILTIACKWKEIFKKSMDDKIPYLIGDLNET